VGKLTPGAHFVRPEVKLSDLTGVSLAVKQAAAAVSAIADDMPSSYESAWHRITRDYRLLTRGLVLTTVPTAARRAIVPACRLLPAVFEQAVHILAR
jgi:hypothetical protein